jgi:hypothetical protein
MSITTNASNLHKQAASEHEAAAQYHLKAAKFQDQNELMIAGECSKSAMESNTKAYKNSENACKYSSNNRYNNKDNNSMNYEAHRISMVPEIVN